MASTTPVKRPRIITLLLLCSMASKAVIGFTPPRFPLYAVTSSLSASNEWGIPDSKDLPPLSSIPPRPSLSNGAKVTLVGSGPGDPNLLTLAAYKLLTDPNVFCIVDRLVSPEIMELIAGEMKVARKMPGCAELAQEEIYCWAHEALKEGKHVVRLKIGDPFVFGRGGEEVLTFRRFGVEPTVIPVRVLSTCGAFLSLSVHHLTHITQMHVPSCYRAFRLPLLLRCWGPSPSPTGVFPTKLSCVPAMVVTERLPI